MARLAGRRDRGRRSGAGALSPPSRDGRRTPPGRSDPLLGQHALSQHHPGRETAAPDPLSRPLGIPARSETREHNREPSKREERPMSDIVIVSAARTPVGTFNGAFANTPAHELGKVAIAAALERAKVDPGEVDEVIFGQVLTANTGQNPTRQTAIAAGIPAEKTAWALNQLCGSGLRTVAIGMQQIANGDADVIVAGGQESMSMAPHAAYMRSGTKMGDFKLVDTMLKDGLLDAFQGYHMGTTAENVANRWQLTREDQDRFAVASQKRPRRPRRPASSRTRSLRSRSRPARATWWWTLQVGRGRLR